MRGGEGLLHVVQRLRKRYDEGANFVPDAGVMGEGFGFCRSVLGELGRVVKPVVQYGGPSGKAGAGLLGVAAEGDDIVKIEVREFLKGFGGLPGDIHSGVGHGADGKGIEAVLDDACALGVDDRGLEVPCKALGHLAAAGVAGAEE